MSEPTQAPSTATPSQAQSTSSEPDQMAVNDPQAMVDEGGDIQHFDGTIAKIDRDGNTVMSDHLAPGERLARVAAEENTDLTSEDNPNASAIVAQQQAAADEREATREEALRRREEAEEQNPEPTDG